MNIEIIESDYSLDDGFCWVCLKIDGETHTLQACLEEGQRKRFIKKYAIGSYLETGTCGDNNRPIFELIGYDAALKILAAQTRSFNIFPNY